MKNFILILALGLVPLQMPWAADDLGLILNDLNEEDRRQIEAISTEDMERERARLWQSIEAVPSGNLEDQLKRYEMIIRSEFAYIFHDDLGAFYTFLEKLLDPQQFTQFPPAARGLFLCAHAKVIVVRYQWKKASIGDINYMGSALVSALGMESLSVHTKESILFALAELTLLQRGLESAAFFHWGLAQWMAQIAETSAQAYLKEKVAALFVLDMSDQAFADYWSTAADEAGEKKKRKVLAEAQNFIAYLMRDNPKFSSNHPLARKFSSDDSAFKQHYESAVGLMGKREEKIPELFLARSLQQETLRFRRDYLAYVYGARLRLKGF